MNIRANLSINAANAFFSELRNLRRIWSKVEMGLCFASCNEVMMSAQNVALQPGSDLIRHSSPLTADVSKYNIAQTGFF